MLNLNLEQSLQYLQSYQLPLSPKSAINYLLNISHQYQLLGLYQHFFPVEYQHSQGSPDRIKQELEQDLESELPSEQEREFMRLVNSKLFPLDLYWVDECEENSFALFQIPLEVCGINWEDALLDDFGLGRQLLILLIHPELGETTASADAAVLHKWALEQIPKDEIDFRKFKRLCALRGEPLTGAPLAIEMLEQNTNNIFLDCYDPEYICEGDREWSIANVTFWTEHWKEADAMLAQINKLLTWLEANPLANFTQLVELWKACLVKSSPKSWALLPALG
jgi:hypothetical protein